MEELKRQHEVLSRMILLQDSDAHYLDHIHEAEWKMKVREKSAAAVIRYLRGMI